MRCLSKKFSSSGILNHCSSKLTCGKNLEWKFSKQLLKYLFFKSVSFTLITVLFKHLITKYYPLLKVNHWFLILLRQALILKISVLSTDILSTDSKNLPLFSHYYRCNHWCLIHQWLLKQLFSTLHPYLCLTRGQFLAFRSK